MNQSPNNFPDSIKADTTTKIKNVLKKSTKETIEISDISTTDNQEPLFQSKRLTASVSPKISSFSVINYNDPENWIVTNPDFVKLLVKHGPIIGDKIDSYPITNNRQFSKNYFKK